MKISCIGKPTAVKLSEIALEILQSQKFVSGATLSLEGLFG